MPADEDRKPTVHMVGNAHIDHAWLWRWRESRQEVLSTCRSALDRMREYPDFVFSFSSAVSYEWIEADAPEMLEEIRERIAEGRWNVVGGWYVQPDCNLPSGEALVRQALYGKRYFQERLGIDVPVGYNVDTFGHAGTLPQILAKAGQPYYVFFRPGPHEKALPNGVFWWQSPDGSRVLACRPPFHYGTGDVDLAARIRQSAEQCPEPLSHVMCFYGVGNHGGGPTIRNIESIRSVQREETALRTIFSTPDAFFAAALAATGEYPVVEEELQHHSRGCYSAVSEIKRANRQAEHGLATAERFAAVARAVFGEPYPRADLTGAWKLALFNQFHDILAGTCIPEVYEDCREDYRKIHALAGGALGRALGAIARRVDTRGPARPILIFNSLPWARSDATRLAVDTKPSPEALLSQNRRPAAARLRDAAGAEVPCQIVRAEHVGGGYRLHLATNAALPGLGYRLLHLELLPSGELPAEERAPRSPEPDPVLENEYLRASVDPCTGWLTSLYDKTLGAELLAGPAAVPTVLHDPSDTWSHGVSSFRDKISHFMADGDVHLVESGPVRSTVRVRSRRGESLVQQEFVLYAGARQLEVDVRIDWHDRWQMLKLAFPLALSEPTATYDAPYGHVVRPTNGEEEPGQQWADVSGRVRRAADGEAVPAGLSLLNDGKYSFDVMGADLRLTALRSPAYAFHDPRKVEPDVEYSYVDQGEQRFRYALVPHAGSWADAAVPRRAWELNVPAIARPEPEHPGELPGAQGFLEVEPAGVVASALKEAEDGDGLVLRLFESVGRPTAARLTFTRFGPEAPVEVDLGPGEVKTLRLIGGRVLEADLLERPLPARQP